MRINGENEAEKQSEERSEQTKALEEARDCGGVQNATPSKYKSERTSAPGVTQANRVLFRAGQQR